LYIRAEILNRHHGYPWSSSRVCRFCIDHLVGASGFPMGYDDHSLRKYAGEQRPVQLVPIVLCDETTQQLWKRIMAVRAPKSKKRTQSSLDSSPNVFLTNGRFLVSLDLAR
jgi:hypothetical protein